MLQVKGAIAQLTAEMNLVTAARRNDGRFGIPSGPHRSGLRGHGAVLPSSLFAKLLAVSDEAELQDFVDDAVFGSLQHHVFHDLT